MINNDQTEDSNSACVAQQDAAKASETKAETTGTAKIVKSRRGLQEPTQNAVVTKGGIARFI
jgi:hypothetical protein